VSPLPVAILAGGLATRLRPVTDKVAKALLPIAGRPFIHWQLGLLAQQGVTEVVLCAGHLGEQIQAAVGDGSGFGMTVRYSFDGDTLLGTGGALKRALPMLGAAFFVLYGDSYLRCSFAAAQMAYESSPALGLMTGFCNEDRWEKSNVLLRTEELARTTSATAFRHAAILWPQYLVDAGPAERPAGAAFIWPTLYELALRGELAALTVSAVSTRSAPSEASKRRNTT
jgi:molybdopterin-guanine dinucleotide biosynthesis protein A